MKENRLYAIICLAVFLDTLLYDIIVPVVPRYATELGASSFELGLIFAAYSFGLLISGIPAGLACDRFGRYRVLLWGIWGLGFTTLLFMMANAIWLLVGARFLQGVAAAGIWSAGLALVADMFPRQKGQKLGTAMSFTGLGTILGPAVGGVLFDHVGYSSPFILSAVLIFGVGLVVWFGSPPLLDNPTTKGDKRSVWQNSNLRWVAVTVVIATFGFGFLEPLLPVYLEEKFQFGSTAVGFSFALISITYTSFQPVWGYLSDRLGRKPLVVTGLLLTAGAVLVITKPDSIFLLGVTLGWLGMVTALIYTPCLPLIAESAGGTGENVGYGTAFGMINSAYSLGLFCGPLLGGLAAVRWGLQGVLGMYAVMLVVNAVGVILGVRETLRRS